MKILLVQHVPVTNFSNCYPSVIRRLIELANHNTQEPFPSFPHARMWLLGKSTIIGNIKEIKKYKGKTKTNSTVKKRLNPEKLGKLYSSENWVDQLVKLYPHKLNVNRPAPKAKFKLFG